MGHFFIPGLITASAAIVGCSLAVTHLCGCPATELGNLAALRHFRHTRNIPNRSTGSHCPRCGSRRRAHPQPPGQYHQPELAIMLIPMVVRDCASTPVGMVPLPAMKALNYDGRSRNPGPTCPINIIASADTDVFGAVPNVIVGRVCHVPGWWRDRRCRWACLHRYRRWRRIATRAAQEYCHDKKGSQYCLFHLFPPFLTIQNSLPVTGSSIKPLWGTTPEPGGASNHSTYTPRVAAPWAPLQ
jgi:hypothetical protein